MINQRHSVFLKLYQNSSLILRISDLSSARVLNKLGKISSKTLKQTLDRHSTGSFWQKYSKSYRKMTSTQSLKRLDHQDAQFSQLPAGQVRLEHCHPLPQDSVPRGSGSKTLFNKESNNNQLFEKCLGLIQR